MAVLKISKNISYKEGTHSNTAIRRRIKNEPNEAQLKAMKTLAKKVFEPLRENFGEPIRVNSFFRSIALNKAIGGSRTSQHCSGEAIDMDGMNGVTNKKIFDYIKKNLDFDQLIWEFGNDKNPDWVHVSYKSAKENRKQVLKAVADGNPVYQIIEAGKEIAQPEAVVSKKKSRKAVVAVKTVLNVRKKPAKDAKVVGQIKNAKKVKIISEEPGWYQIKADKHSGWVSADYIKLKSTNSTSSPEQ
ncbi:MAG: D-Ala-D-Ala carboxypeptidase family metallohydrolase [Vicingaceae bacterium]|nr:D-Ala-D-Ala carboxypeptidase family metallohydrolase [Vicingaceae bacterium]